MAHHVMRPCSHAGCPELVNTGGYCETHQVLVPPRVRPRGPSAAALGYDRRWAKISRQVLKEEPHCRACGEPATITDHIIPKKLGGTDDRSNLQALCLTCHQRKRQAESMQARTAQKALRARGGRGDQNFTGLTAECASGLNSQKAKIQRGGYPCQG